MERTLSALVSTNGAVSSAFARLGDADGVLRGIRERGTRFDYEALQLRRRRVLEARVSLLATAFCAAGRSAPPLGLMPGDLRRVEAGEEYVLGVLGPRGVIACCLSGRPPMRADSAGLLADEHAEAVAPGMVADLVVGPDPSSAPWSHDARVGPGAEVAPVCLVKGVMLSTPRTMRDDERALPVPVRRR